MELDRKYFVRIYKKGDEIDINHLYKVIANIDRTAEEHRWQWVDTWDGVGEMYLMFDSTRPKGKQLVCQYSIMPTSISYFGKVMPGGKTENCMSHPDLRGKKLFFPFEKENFENVKSRFDFFFTTTGLGAPGAIRRKLGYKAVDYWIDYHFFWEAQDGFTYYHRDIKRVLKKAPKLAVSFVTTIFKRVNNLQCYKKLKKLNAIVEHSFNVSTYEKGKTLMDIQELWSRNRENYGISIERSLEYMDWRINQNPYFEHKYICLYEKNLLVAYVIFHEFELNTYKIVDLIVDEKDVFIAKCLMSELLKSAYKDSKSGVTCSTLLQNKFLKQVFLLNGFGLKNFTNIKKKFSKDKREDRPFHGYIKPTIDSSDKLEIASNWYITELCKEGRTFPTNA